MSIATDKEELEMEIHYSLAKRVPAMAGGFSIQTSYGCIHADSEDAAPVIKAVESALNKMLRRLS